MKLYYLEITSFRGISIGAEHYYGQIKFHNNTETFGIEKIDLKRKMSKKDILLLNKKDSYRSYSVGDETDRCDTKEEIIKLAKNKFSEISKKDDILIWCDYASCSARPLLLWPKSFNKKAIICNKLAKEWKDIDGYEGNEKRAGEIDDKWYSILKDYFESKE